MWAVFIAVLELTGSAASAQEDAESLILRGVELRRSGQDDEAVALFQRAYEIDASPRAAAQLGLALQALGRWTEAYGHLRTALDSSDPWVESNRAALDGAFTRVQENVGLLRVLGGVSGAEVLLDGEVVSALPMSEAIAVRIGSRTLEVRADGHYPYSTTLTVLPGELSRETVELRVRESNASDVPAEIEQRRAVNGVANGDGPSLLQVLGWIGIATGAVTGAAGGVAYFVRENAAENWNDDARCLTGGRTREENCSSDRARAETAEITGYVLAAAGGALVLTGIVLLVADAASDGESDVACAPAIDGSGWLCGATF